MAVRSITHIALRVPSLPAAERLYASLFGLEVAYREAEMSDGWRTLREHQDWEDGLPAGVTPGMTVMFRDGFRLALEATASDGGAGVLDHIGLLTEEADLDAIRSRATAAGCSVVHDSPTAVVLVDPLGVHWELASSVGGDPRASSHGAQSGRWIGPN